MWRLIGTVTGVYSAPIRFESDGGRRSVGVGDVLHMEVHELKGMDGVRRAVISNPLLGSVTQPFRQAKSGTLSYKGDWECQRRRLKRFITEFEYRSSRASAVCNSASVAPCWRLQQPPGIC